MLPPDPQNLLIDQFGRRIEYLRVSVTDRCDLRCVYCMAEHMEFLPKVELLTLDELDRLVSAFVARGVKKVRLTGGEPLVRKNIMKLVCDLGRHLESGALEELTLTTNGTMLEKFAQPLADAGVRRINVSLDTLDQLKFARITRRNMLPAVLRGIEAAHDAGIEIKINTVALAHDNRAELPFLIEWAHGRGYDITLIETMPMGEIDEDRTDQYLPLSTVRQELQSFWTLEDIPLKTGGPARYVKIKETGGRLGFITPLTHNFCESCNRVRLTCTGTLYQCLGQEEHIDLRETLRASERDDLLNAALDRAMLVKPKGHDFVADRLGKPAVPRFMSTTGG